MRNRHPGHADALRAFAESIVPVFLEELEASLGMRALWALVCWLRILLFQVRVSVFGTLAFVLPSLDVSALFRTLLARTLVHRPKRCEGYVRLTTKTLAYPRARCSNSSVLVVILYISLTGQVSWPRACVRNKRECRRSSNRRWQVKRSTEVLYK